jgi:hypothetical protein
VKRRILPPAAAPAPEAAAPTDRIKVVTIAAYAWVLLFLACGAAGAFEIPQLDPFWHSVRVTLLSRGQAVGIIGAAATAGSLGAFLVMLCGGTLSRWLFWMVGLAYGFIAPLFMMMVTGTTPELSLSGGYFWIPSPSFWASVSLPSLQLVIGLGAGIIASLARDRLRGWMPPLVGLAVGGAVTGVMAYEHARTLRLADQLQTLHTAGGSSVTKLVAVAPDPLEPCFLTVLALTLMCATTLVLARGHRGTASALRDTR